MSLSETQVKPRRMSLSTHLIDCRKVESRKLMESQEQESSVYVAPFVGSAYKSFSETQVKTLWRSSSSHSLSKS